MRDTRLVEFAKSMRREMTEPETRLWLQLRAKRFEGIKFRRQNVVGHYIADFCSRAAMLVIEVDGDSHGNQILYDTERTRYLNDMGYKVIRFTNADVIRNLEGVLTSILFEIATPPLPTLSPKGERVNVDALGVGL